MVRQLFDRWPGTRRILGGPVTRRLQLAIALFVSDEVHNAMSRLQLEILNRYERCPEIGTVPHITLKLGFPVTDIAPYEAYFDEIAEQAAPFRLEVRDLGFFDEGIIFVDVVPSVDLDRLRRRIVHDLESRFGVQPYPLEGDAFHFHATLTRDLPHRDFEDARRRFGERTFRSAFDVRSIGLFCHTGAEWLVYKRAELQPS